MNVVRLVGEFPSFKEIPPGLGPTFYNLSREQVKLGMNVHVICRRYPHQMKFEEMDGIRVHRVVAPYTVSSFYELIKLSKQAKIDLVHVHATTGLMFTVLRKLLHQERIKVGCVAHVHGTTKGVLAAHSKYLPNTIHEATFKQRFRRLVSVLRESIIWDNSDALIAVSNSVANELTHFYNIPKEKIHVVHNGVDPQVFYSRRSRGVVLNELGLDPNTHLILYLGGFRHLKGPTYLIEAMKEVREKLRNVKVIFVGNPRQPLERHSIQSTLHLIKRLKVNDVIHIIENIPHHQLPEYYSAVDVLVVPSIYDAFPKVVLEAMACGTPVIASAIGGLREIISDGENGILVRPGYSEGLAEAVIQTLSDSDLREKMSLQCRQRIEKQLTWTHAAKRILDIYEELRNI